MNVSKNAVMIESEMRIWEFRQKPTDEVYACSMASLSTMKSIGLLNDKEYNGYTERLAIIKKAASIQVPVPAPAPAGSE